jgi:uncharacterized protein YecE (DUF72 family)
MRRLGPKLGPVLFHLSYFRRDVFENAGALLDRLAPFVAELPTDFRHAVEVCNKQWMLPPLLDLLRRHHIALARIDHPWMPRPTAYAPIPGIVTTGFRYVRWLVDRHAADEMTTTWDRLILDQTMEMDEWATVLREMNKRADRIYAYYNNQYAGCGYQSAQRFLDLRDKAP